MKINWCKIIGHDWEIIKKAISYDYPNLRGFGYQIEGGRFEYPKYFYHKKCKRCNKEIDDITNNSFVETNKK